MRRRSQRTSSPRCTTSSLRGSCVVDGRGEVLWRSATTAGVGVYVEDCGGAACVDKDTDREPA